MEIRNAKHKGLKRLIEEDDRSGFQRKIADKLRSMVAYVMAAETLEVILKPPKWDGHYLKGSRKDTVSLHVTGNWRLTFRVDHDTGELFDLNYEDYH